jgi:hypothetical protein
VPAPAAAVHGPTARAADLEIKRRQILFTHESSEKIARRGTNGGRSGLDQRDLNVLSELLGGLVANDAAVFGTRRRLRRLDHTAGTPAGIVRVEHRLHLGFGVGMIDGDEGHQRRRSIRHGRRERIRHPLWQAKHLAPHRCGNAHQEPTIIVGELARQHAETITHLFFVASVSENVHRLVLIEIHRKRICSELQQVADHGSFPSRNGDVQRRVAVIWIEWLIELQACFDERVEKHCVPFPDGGVGGHPKSTMDFRDFRVVLVSSHERAPREHRKENNVASFHHGETRPNLNRLQPADIQHQRSLRLGCPRFAMEAMVVAILAAQTPADDHHDENDHERDDHEIRRL